LGYALDSTNPYILCFVISDYTTSCIWLSQVHTPV